MRLITNQLVLNFDSTNILLITLFIFVIQPPIYMPLKSFKIYFFRSVEPQDFITILNCKTKTNIFIYHYLYSREVIAMTLMPIILK